MTGKRKMKAGFPFGKGATGIRFGVLIIFLFFSGVSVIGQRVIVELMDDNIEVGDLAVIELRYENVQVPRTARAVGPYEYDGFEIIPTQSTKRTFVNGQTTYIFYSRLRATKAGDWTIPSFEVPVGNRTFMTEEVKFKIYQKGMAPKSKFPRNTPAFLNVEVPERTVYIGQSIPVTIEIYHDDSCSRPTWPEIEAAGFKLEDKEQGRTYQMMLYGRRFSVTETFRVAVPLKTGKLTLGPATGSVQKMSGSFGSLMGFSSDQIRITGEAVEIECIPFPEENQPESFNGAVGSEFVVTYKASPLSLNFGDPVTVNINIAGQGNISEIQLPDTFDFSRFKTYPAKTDSMIVDKQKMQGRKNFEFVVIPQESGISALPDLGFSYFDTTNKVYRTISKPGPQLQIKGAQYHSESGKSAGSPRSDENPSLPDDQLAHIVYKPGPIMTGTGAPASARMVFWVVPGIFLISSLGAAAWRTASLVIRGARSGHSTNRNGGAHEDHQNRLYELNMFAQANQPKSFFSTLFRLLQDILGRKLGCQSSAITADILNRPEILNGLGDNQRETLSRMFELCDQARYGMNLDAVDLPSIKRDFEELTSIMEKM